MIFLNSASSAAALMFYLPSGGSNVKSGVHTLTPRENRGRSESGIFLKILEKTQYLMNTLYLNIRIIGVVDVVMCLYLYIRIVGVVVEFIP